MPRRRQRKRTTNKDVSSQASGEHLPYSIKKSDIMGRYVVASCDLPEGATVISEDALIIGPVPDCPPVCLGCYSAIPDIDTSFKCLRCQWPLCSKDCKGLYRRLGHSKEECSQLSLCAMKSSHLPKNQLYNAIVSLRCLLLIDNDPPKWEIIISMEAHNDIRKKIPSIWNYNQKSVVDRIRNEWKITKFSEEEIHTICGILEVNAFAVGDDSLNIRGLYPTSFLLAHSCLPNTAHMDDEEFHIKIFTAVPVLKDELLSLSYTTSMKGTSQRRAHLKQCKFFDCECVRCKDPTELKTYISAVKCNKCSGYLLASNPLAYGCEWKCDNKQCGFGVSAASVDTVVDRIDLEIKSLDQNNIESLENCIKKYNKVLHENHFLIHGMKYTLSQLYGKSVGFMIHEMSDSMLERKKQICEEVLKIFDVIEPGLTRVRGVTMYELHAPLMILTIKTFETHKISKVDLCRRLRKVAFYLKECSRILKHEINTSQEGSIRVAAEEALVQLKSWEVVTGKL